MWPAKLPVVRRPGQHMQAFVARNTCANLATLISNVSQAVQCIIQFM